MPLAAVVKLTAPPTVAVWLMGCVVMVGATVAGWTLRVAAADDAEPATLVATST